MPLDPATQTILNELAADITALKATLATMQTSAATFETKLAGLKGQAAAIVEPGSGLHSNGLGQTYVDAGVLLGQPGIPGTYNAAMAQSARTAWPVQGADFAATVQTPSGPTMVLIRKTATTAAVWAYTGTLAGRVRLNTTNSTPQIPSANDSVWT